MKLLIILLLCINDISAQTLPSPLPKLKSLAFPGWGEQSLGKPETAQGFFMREAALWMILLGAKQSSNYYESDYQAFAEIHADVDMAAKNYLFAVNLAHYDSFELFNETKERQRAVGDKYPESEGYEWQWDSTANRIEFDNMRIQSATLNKYAKFAAGGLVLHRLISFFDVIYLERQNLPINVGSQISPDNTFQLNINIQF
mgnify:CR=1 FL=1